MCVYLITVLFSIAFLAYQDFGFSVQEWANCVRRMPFCSAMSSTVITPDSGGDFYFLSSCLVLSCLVWSCRVVSCRVVSCLALSGPGWAGLVLSCLVFWSCLDWSGLVLPCLVLFCCAVLCLCRVVLFYRGVVWCVLLCCVAVSCPRVYYPLYHGDREFLFSSVWRVHVGQYFNGKMMVSCFFFFIQTH